MVCNLPPSFAWMLITTYLTRRHNFDGNFITHFLWEKTILNYPDRSVVYLQCHAVYTAGTLQPMQCTCSIGCSYTADTLQTAVYTVPTLHVHCRYLHCRMVSYGSILYTAHTLPSSGSVPALYVQPSLQLHCLYTPLRSGLIYMSTWMGQVLGIHLPVWNK